MAVRLGGAIMSRRRFLSSSGAFLAAGSVAMPRLSRAVDRPRITHGIQSGDISIDGGIVWARADRAARMIVEVSTTESFREIVGCGACGCAGGKRFHREGAAGQFARRSGHFLPRGVRGHRITGCAASRRLGAFARRRARSVTSRLRGPATRAAAGASTSAVAACARMRPCCATGRISSFTVATTFTPNVRSEPSRSSRTARSGTMW